MENHGTTEWFGMEGTLKPIHGWGHLPQTRLLQSFNASRNDIWEGREILGNPGPARSVLNTGPFRGTLWSLFSMALQDHPCPDGALQSPDLATFRQEGKEQREGAVESCSRRKHWIVSPQPRSQTLLTGRGWHPGVAVAREGPLVRELGFCPRRGETPRGAAPDPAKPGPGV